MLIFNTGILWKRAIFYLPNYQAPRCFRKLLYTAREIRNLSKARGPGDRYPSRIPDLGVKKAPDPGSGFATLISMKRRIFWYPIRPIQKKKVFVSFEGTKNLFGILKGKKKKMVNISKTIFYKQILYFLCLSKILCHTSKFIKFCQSLFPTQEPLIYAEVVITMSTFSE